MFGKLFGRKDKTEQQTQSSTPQEAALLRAINEKRKEDPLIGAKIGAKEITQRLIEALKNERGVSVETLLASIGSLGGFACHMAIKDGIIKPGKAKENEVFTIIGGADGKNYYFGDMVNRPLAEDRISFWGLAGGAAQQLDKDGLPDIQAIFKHVASTVGGEGFGIPQMPEKHQPSNLPIDIVRSFWPALLPLIDKFCESPVERPYLFGFCAQEVIEMGKDVIAPGMAAKLLMECAIPMSKIGPEWLEEQS